MNKQLPIGMVMLDVAGLSLTAHEQEIINHPNTGAVILFSRNFDNLNQLEELIASIRAARHGTVLIAVDQEGGRVQRFRNGFTRLPPASAYAQQPQTARQAGWLMAAELLAAGVDFSFAPVLDVDAGVSEIIGDRAFSNDAELAASIASNFRLGMNDAGMAATGKHFPGHGFVALDSHLTLPEDPRSLQAIRARDLLPFKKLINEGLEAIMPAHVVYPEVDSNPAGFSRIWIEQILRGELNFNGAIFSDDLSMEGAASIGDFPTRAKAAQDAGCDMILVCNNPVAANEVLDALPTHTDAIREQRLLAMQGKPKMNSQQLKASDQWLQVSRIIQQMSQSHA
jgi:beta-N-acetylhexosaminidase